MAVPLRPPELSSMDAAAPVHHLARVWQIHLLAETLCEVANEMHHAKLAGSLHELGGERCCTRLRFRC